MAMTHYDPWNRLNQLHRDLDRFFDNRLSQGAGEDSSHVATCDWTPPVDIKEEQNHFVLYADIPGVNAKEIEITMENGTLTIRGQRGSAAEENREAYKRLERPQGSFYRRFSLPDTVDVEKISAKGQDGVLEVVIPKQARTQPRTIAVQS